MTNINDDSVSPIKRGLVYPTSIEVKEEESKHGSDVGVSSIEKSKAVPGTAVAPMNAPILISPSDQAVFAISSVDATGKKMIQILSTVALKIEGIKNDVLEGWAQNLRQIEEQIRQILASPAYIQLQEMRTKGDPRSGTVSGVQSAASAAKSGLAGGSDSITLLSTLDRMQVLEKIPPTAEVQDTTPPQNPSRSLILPLAAAILMGGALAVGTVQLTTSLTGISSNVLTNVVKLVEQLQPLFSTFTVRDLVPAINLMIVGPLYMNSWKEAVSNFGNKERNSNIETVHKFAQDVIKMVSDPTSLLRLLVSQSAGKTPISEGEIDQRTHMLKLIMVGVALSLLYSVEVGQIQGGKFRGIQPEELRDLLLGKMQIKQDPEAKPTRQEELIDSLIKRGKEQVSLILREEDKVKAAEILVGYVYQERELEHLLDPEKIFNDTLAAMAFDPKEQKQSDAIKG